MGSLIRWSFESHEGTAIPPKKLSGSSLLLIINNVEPFNTLIIIISSINALIITF